MDAQWWSIEVFDGERPAWSWRDSYQGILVESAITNGAVAWEWYQHTWGVVFEVAFTDEDQWLSWRALPGTQAALDSVPDPVNGLLIYRGRGGSSGATVPRPVRPAPGAAAVELPEPDEDDGLIDLRAIGPREEPDFGRDIPLRTSVA